VLDIRVRLACGGRQQDHGQESRDAESARQAGHDKHGQEAADGRRQVSGQPVAGSSIPRHASRWQERRSRKFHGRTKPTGDCAAWFKSSVWRHPIFLALIFVPANYSADVVRSIRPSATDTAHPHTIGRGAIGR
jgi:hypothetical protein